MQIARLSVTNLFGRASYDLLFPTTEDLGENNQEPSVLILHGKNGVGKTTLLRMLDGFMKLDFDVFRSVPFDEAFLEFNRGGAIRVTKSPEDLRVSFDGEIVSLHLGEKGPSTPSGRTAVDDFRTTFFKATESIDFEFVETGRDHAQSSSDFDLALQHSAHLLPSSVDGRLRLTRRPSDRESESLANRVRSFIRNAQLDTQRFFIASGADLFPRMIESLTSGAEPRSYSTTDLISRLDALNEREIDARKYGLVPLDWSYAQLIEAAQRLTTDDSRALTVLAVYLDALEAQSQSRSLVESRLRTFENIMSNFLHPKHLAIHARSGFTIRTGSGSELEESQLSSGERHLLYLMVTALVTQRRGTVIAIDEPELSLHTSWQRVLVKRLIECASMAAPQLILATHSPDIAGDYRDRMLSLDVKQ